MLRVQRKYFCKLYNGFRIASTEPKIQEHTKSRKTLLAIPLADADEFFRGSKKRRPL